MRESLVGFCHLVDVFFLLESAAHAVLGIHDLGCKALRHGALASCTRIRGDPTQTESLASVSAYFHRNLIVGTTYTASLNLKNRHYVIESLGENVQRILTHLLLNDLECVVNDNLGNTLLTVQHDVVDELGYKLGVVKRIRQNVSLGNLTSSRHCTSLLH